MTAGMLSGKEVTEKPRNTRPRHCRQADPVRLPVIEALVCFLTGLQFGKNQATSSRVAQAKEDELGHEANLPLPVRVPMWPHSPDCDETTRVTSEKPHHSGPEESANGHASHALLWSNPKFLDIFPSGLCQEEMYNFIVTEMNPIGSLRMKGLGSAINVAFNAMTQLQLSRDPLSEAPLGIGRGSREIWNLNPAAAQVHRFSRTAYF